MVPRRLGRPVSDLVAFLRSEAAGGALLILASVIALAWSNSPYRAGYMWLTNTRLGLHGLPIHAVVNEGLMSLFFLLAGLEIRREMTQGRLATLRGAIAPAVAALGGMIAPALIYLALNHDNAATARGWAVPVATDIAFSLAVLRVLGERASFSLRVFLTALAILDDLGAILVIAFFYAASVSWPALAGALGLGASIWGMNRVGVQTVWPYLVAGAALWVLIFSSGVHATFAGVALAFLVPGRRGPGGADSVSQRLEHGLADLVAYVILPIFGLVNAGLSVDRLQPSVLLSPAPLGIILALFLGKQAGVFGATMVGKKLRLLTLPPPMGTAELYGAALLCGIGFTMSLFIADLAFRGTAYHDGVKLAVFCGSVASALAGMLVLWGVSFRAERKRHR